MEARVEKRKIKLGPEDPATLVSMNNLAFAYRKQERWKEAEKIQLHGIKSCKLASWHQGQYTEAEELCTSLHTGETQAST